MTTAIEFARNLVDPAESCSLTAYQDPVGIWTIGWGSIYLADGSRVTADTPPLTQDEADALRDAELLEKQRIVRAAVKVPLTPWQEGALISFVYNEGPGAKGVKDGFVELKAGGPSTMLRLLNAGDYDGAANEFPKWDLAGGRVLNGLVRRRLAEQATFRGQLGT